MPDTTIVPAYEIETETIVGPVTALRNGKILAQSKEAVLMRETRLGPTIYFPKKDLSVELIKQPDFRTFCRH
jgi:adenylate cyclase